MTRIGLAVLAAAGMTQWSLGPLLKFCAESGAETSVSVAAHHAEAAGHHHSAPEPSPERSDAPATDCDAAPGCAAGFLTFASVITGRPHPPEPIQPSEPDELVSIAREPADPPPRA